MSVLGNEKVFLPEERILDRELKTRQGTQGVFLRSQYAFTAMVSSLNALHTDDRVNGIK
jgi:hypothetical protein